MRYRSGARFVMDVRAHSRPLDRNAIARLLYLAGQLDRRTKLKGRRNGALGYAGLAVLQVLALRFLNRTSGLCCPSYDAIRKATGLAKQTVARAIRRLEAMGIIKGLRRIVRRQVSRVSPITGRVETYVATVQATNLYTLHEPKPGAELISTSEPVKVRAFPMRGMLAQLAAGVTLKAESTQKAVTHQVCVSEMTYVTPVLHDWRARARQALEKGTRR